MFEATDRRTILLIAPAGYGKTILARQWLEQAGGAWVQITAASADVPVLARDVATAIASVAPLDLRRIETALNAGQTPIETARTVARLILSQVPANIDPWLVLDDYQHLIGSPAAEELVREIEGSARFRLLVTSRERPTWETPRRRVYLEALELGQTSLALDTEEVAQLLPEQATDFSLKARGWPAVVALAAHAEVDSLPFDAGELTSTLYEYFAQELFGRAPDNVQRSLCAVAIMPVLGVDEIDCVLGFAGMGEQLVATGLAYENERHLEVHPLARDFLIAKLRASGEAHAVASTGFDLALARGSDSEAFSIARDFELADRLEELITASYSALIETGRVATLAGYGRYAEANGKVPQYILDLIHAETSLVEGAFERCCIRGAAAGAACPDRHPLKSRGYLLAARASYFLWDLDAAYAYLAFAIKHAAQTDDLNEAIWVRWLVSVFRQDEDAKRSLRELESIEHQRPTDRVRIDSARISYTHLTGDGRFTKEQPDSWHLLSHITDPLVRSSLTYGYGYSLVLQAQYAEALHTIRTTLAEMTDYGLAFGVPHVEWALAAAELGLRHFARCDAVLLRIERRLLQTPDHHLDLNTRALRARLHLAQQRCAEALNVVSEEFDIQSGPSMYGEYLATRALAFAVAGQVGEAEAAARRAVSRTDAVEAGLIAAATRAIVEVRTSESRNDASALLLEHASRINAWDGVICAVRAYPLLLPRLMSVNRSGNELREALLRSKDVALAKAVGLVTRSTGHGVLSPREREIMEYVRQGQRNADIATSLFISRGTVKSHLDHIFDKLGVRSRTGAVMRYAEIENVATDESVGS